MVVVVSFLWGVMIRKPRNRYYMWSLFVLLGGSGRLRKALDEPILKGLSSFVRHTRLLPPFMLGGIFHPAILVVSRRICSRSSVVLGEKTIRKCWLVDFIGLAGGVWMESNIRLVWVYPRPLTQLVNSIMISVGYLKVTLPPLLPLPPAGYS